MATAPKLQKAMARPVLRWRDRSVADSAHFPHLKEPARAAHEAREPVDQLAPPPPDQADETEPQQRTAQDTSRLAKALHRYGRANLAATTPRRSAAMPVA